MIFGYYILCNMSWMIDYMIRGECLINGIYDDF